jgi:hypothetical protein
VARDPSCSTLKDYPAYRAAFTTRKGQGGAFRILFGHIRHNVAKAKAALELALADRKLAARQFRLLGCNGPGTPRAKRTWELQALLALS